MISKQNHKKISDEVAPPFKRSPTIMNSTDAPHMIEYASKVRWIFSLVLFLVSSSLLTYLLLSHFLSSPSTLHPMIPNGFQVPLASSVQESVQAVRELFVSTSLSEMVQRSCFKICHFVRKVSSVPHLELAVWQVNI